MLLTQIHLFQLHSTKIIPKNIKIAADGPVANHSNSLTHVDALVVLVLQNYAFLVQI